MATLIQSTKSITRQQDNYAALLSIAPDIIHIDKLKKIDLYQNGLFCMHFVESDCTKLRISLSRTIERDGHHLTDLSMEIILCKSSNRIMAQTLRSPIYRIEDSNDEQTLDNLDEFLKNWLAQVLATKT